MTAVAVRDEECAAEPQADAGTWRGRGCSVPTDLALRVESAARRVYDVVGADLAGLEAWAVADFVSAEATLNSVVGLLRRLLADATGERLAGCGDLVDLLLEVTAVQRDLECARMTTRLAAVSQVQQALSRLARVGSVTGLIDRAPEEVCRLGFDRAFISRVHGSTWVPEAVHVVGDPEWADEILHAGRARPQPLNHMILETGMVRRHAPLLVTKVQDDPRVHRSIAGASRSRSYVAAPIMASDGGVIGFLHADRYLQGRHVDESDRDLLWQFAQGFGPAFERTVLLERLRGVRGEVSRLTGQIAAVTDQFVDAGVEMAKVDLEQIEEAVRPMRVAFVPEESPAEPFPCRNGVSLTRREAEVARLMADGLTNADIAARLVISDGTVKSHIKHILRKLGAANRAEGVSIYLRASTSHHAQA